MAYGVTSGLAHLDALDSGGPVPGEIDWAALRAWQGGTAPAFAGRYFLGTPTQQEADLDVAFCLWAHGEGTDPATPSAIVPLQRSDPTRQQAVGALGAQLGEEDALAIGTYLERCDDVGDLVLPFGRFFVLVFLDVAVGTQLSADYWSAWAHTIKGMVLDLHPQGLVRPLEPAIACAFVQDTPGGPFLPEQPVRDCLTQPVAAGRHSLCHGFWCRTPVANAVFGEFVQDPEEGPVPVRYRCTFDGPGGSPVPSGTPAAVQPTLALVTLDEPVAGFEDPLAYTLETQPWNPVAPPPPDTTTPPQNLPTQFGVDIAYANPTSVASRGRAAQCMRNEEVVLHALPTGNSLHDLGTQFPGASVLHGRPRFAARYLPGHPDPRDGHFNGLTIAEARDLAAAGMPVCSIWQLGRTMTGGFGHAVQAFGAAEQRVGQPPYTPVYFAVDVTVDDPREPGGPTLQTVIDYFQDVRRGYRQYLANGGTTPYYVGVYGAARVLDTLYRGGLATHFWQAWPPSWAPPVPMPADWGSTASGWRAWPHLNLWQVFLENSRRPAVLADNLAIRTCAPGGVDGNVAWGDPGSWVPR